MEFEPKERSLPLKNFFVEESSEEGFITNEPPGNEYPKIEKNNLDKFPYFLIGQIRTVFNIPYTQKAQKQGVGMLVGPNIVLTAAHNLCQKILNDKKEKTIFNAIEVSFSPASSENFEPINKSIKTENYYINDKYIDLLREHSTTSFDKLDEKYKNDWALIFLSYNVGDHLTKLFDIEERAKEKLVVKNGLYQFFVDSINFPKSLKEKTETSKAISLIAYIEKDYDHNMDNFDINSENEKEYIEDNIRPINPINLDSSIIGDSHSIAYSEANVKLQKEYKNHKLIDNDIPSQKNIINFQSTNKKKNDFVLFKAIQNPLNCRELRNSSFRYKPDLLPTMTMCETKGFLYFPKEDVNENYLYYQFHTLKGQSGAPLFLREKIEGQNTYDYIFLGMHIRRGPNFMTPFQELNDFQFDVESKVLSSTTEVHHKGKNEEELNFIPKSNLTLSGSKKKANTHMCLSPLERKLRKEHGECEYNIALKITNYMINGICNILSSYLPSNVQNDRKSSIGSLLFYGNNNSEPPYVSNYLMINLYYNNQKILKGLFNRNSELMTIFQVSGKLLNIKKKFICLEIRSFEDIKYRTYHKKIYEFDKNKKLYDLLYEGTGNNNLLNNTEYCLTFDIGVNISLLSDFHAERILNKVAQTYTIDINLIRQNPVKYSKYLTVAIFSEIEKFNNLYPTFGNLFQNLQIKLGLK